MANRNYINDFIIIKRTIINNDKKYFIKVLTKQIFDDINRTTNKSSKIRRKYKGRKYREKEGTRSSNEPNRKTIWKRLSYETRRI